MHNDLDDQKIKCVRLF